MYEFTWAPIRPKKSIDALLSRTKEFCLLVGSGVSLDPPSSLPTGERFMSEILMKLIPCECQGRIPHILGPRAFDSKNNFLRFEKLMSHLQAWDPKLELLRFYGECKSPNRNHLILGGLARTGHILFTTNYDNLLEIGIRQTGCPKDAIVPVIHKKDWESGLRDDLIQVYKLHGSFIDYRDGSDSSGTVLATIEAIGAETNAQMRLPEWKTKVFNSALANNDLLVLGYSGLDDFDIMPSIASVESTHRLIWIEHQSNIRLQDARIEVATPVESSKSQRSHPAFSAGRTRLDERIIRIVVDTREFLGYLADANGLTATQMEEENCPLFRLRLPRTLELTEAQKWFLAADIYSYYSAEGTVSMAERAAAEARTESNPLLEGLAMNLLGRQFATCFEYEESKPERDRFWDLASQCYAQAEVLLEEIGTTDALRAISTTLNNIGHLLQHKPDLANKALQSFKAALCIAEETSDRRGISRVLSNIAALRFDLKEYTKAIRLGSRACEIDRELGNIGALCAHLHNVGWYKLCAGDKSGSEDISEALRLARATGAVDAEVLCLFSLGHFAKARRSFKEALSQYEDAYAAAEIVGHPLIAPIADRINDIRKKQPTIKRSSPKENANQNSPPWAAHPVEPGMTQEIHRENLKAGLVRYSVDGD